MNPYTNNTEIFHCPFLIVYQYNGYSLTMIAVHLVNIKPISQSKNIVIQLYALYYLNHIIFYENALQLINVYKNH